MTQERRKGITKRNYIENKGRERERERERKKKRKKKDRREILIRTIKGKREIKNEA